MSVELIEVVAKRAWSGKEGKVRPGDKITVGLDRCVELETYGRAFRSKSENKNEEEKVEKVEVKGDKSATGYAKNVDGEVETKGQKSATGKKKGRGRGRPRKHQGDVGGYGGGD